MNTTYTLIDHDGDVEVEGMSLEDVGREILTHDGYEYDIRADERLGGWRLWISQHSRNSTGGGRPLVKSVVFSLEETEAAATADILRQVTTHEGWSRWTVMTDADYAEQEARLRAENEAAA